MNRFGLFLFIILKLSFGFNSNLIAQSEFKLNEQVPNFEFIDLEGEIIKKTDLTGKILIIDFWATWCAPCLKSFPALIESEKEFLENEDVKFLFVNTLEAKGRSGDFIKGFLKKKGFSM